jgi:glutamate carboxypeptidase
MDTVFGVGTVAARPFRVDGRRAYGPGVEDMKSGLVAAVYAARALTELDLWPGHEVTFFFNSDEEIRSPSSDHIFAREGGVADECYVLEGARDDGSVVTARKGSARLQLHVTGRPSHSGANHPAGRSAIRALAHKILALEALTDYDLGTTVNVGVVKGGLSFNTVPGEAWCDIDIRVMTPALAERAVAAVHAIAAREDVPGVTARAEGGITRPPMVRTEHNVAIFQACRRIAALLGRDLTESLTGGGSDGCLTAAAGAPTLDGLGPAGGGAHTPDEWLDLDTLVPCAAMLAMALATGPHARRPERDGAPASG